MIEAIRGDLLRADVEAMVNPVNCIGHMGKGLALQFKRAFPANFNAYAIACKAGKVTPSAMFIHDTAGLMNPRSISSFHTKRHGVEESLLEEIVGGLVTLVPDIRLRPCYTPRVDAGAESERRRKVMNTYGRIWTVMNRNGRRRE